MIKLIIATDKQLINIYNNFLLKYILSATCVLDLTDSTYFDYHTGIKFTILWRKHSEVKLLEGGDIYQKMRSNLRKLYRIYLLYGYNYWQQPLHMKKNIKKILIPFQY